MPALLFMYGTEFYHNDGTTAHPYPVCSNNCATNNTAAGQSQIKVPVAGTLTRLGCGVPLNNRTGNPTLVRCRINGTNGNQVASVPAGTTGLFQDTTHTDAVAANDLYDVTMQHGSAGSDLLKVGNMFMAWQATTGDGRPCCNSYGHGAVFGTASTTTYQSIQGHIDSVTCANEAYSSFTTRAAGTYRNFRVVATSNARVTDTVVRFRKNGSNGNQVVTIPATTTGAIEDTTNTDAVTNGDVVNYSITTGTGTQSLYIGMLSIYFVASTGDANDITGCSNISAGSSGPLGNRFLPLMGSHPDLSSETLAPEMIAGMTGRLSNLRHKAASSPYGAHTVTYRLRKDTGGGNTNGNQVIVRAAGQTGLIEDTVSVDDFNAGDILNLSVVPTVALNLGNQSFSLTCSPPPGPPPGSGGGTPLIIINQ
jgi:hypothetical protein